MHHAHRRRQKPVLSTAHHRPRRRHDRDLTTDRVNERPSRLVDRTRHPSDVHQQHPHLGRTTISHRRHGRWQIQTDLHRPRTTPQQFVHAVSPTHQDPTTRRRRSPLHLAMGTRLPPRLRATGPIPRTLGQPANGCLNRHRDQSCSRRHRQNPAI